MTFKFLHILKLPYCANTDMFHANFRENILCIYSRPVHNKCSLQWHCDVVHKRRCEHVCWKYGSNNGSDRNVIFCFIYNKSLQASTLVLEWLARWRGWDEITFVSTYNTMLLMVINGELHFCQTMKVNMPDGVI